MSDTKPKTAAPKTAGRKVSVDSDGTIHVKNAPKKADSPQPTPQPQPAQEDNGGCVGCFGELFGIFFWAMAIMLVLHLLGLA